MADEGDLVAVMVLGFVVLSYAILFYLCDKEYRNNFGLTIEDVSTVDTVAITVEKAKDQFNQMALRFDKLKVCKKWRDMINNLYRKKIYLCIRRHCVEFTPNPIENLQNIFVIGARRSSGSFQNLFSIHKAT